MPVIAAAVCPHPPMLVPEVATGAAPELADLRAACAAAVAHLLAAQADELLILGAGPHPSGATVGRPDLPLSLAIGAWLMDRAGAGAAFRVIPTDLPTAECARIGQEYASADERLAVLVMGDGSACRGPQSPGYDDPRAESFDTGVAAALAAADTAALLDLDPGLAGELRCAGRAPWQVLAGAASPTHGEPGATGPTRHAEPGATGPTWRGELRYDAAPYGVAYFVATWSPPPTPSVDHEVGGPFERRS